jgi:CRP-like cAMP-binding protein
MMMRPSIADLTVDEFKSLVREIVTQTFLEIFSDPDEGLELCEEMRDRLQQSLAAVQTGGQTTSAQQVAARLGLDW